MAVTERPPGFLASWSSLHGWTGGLALRWVWFAAALFERRGVFVAVVVLLLCTPWLLLVVFFSQALDWYPPA